MAQPFHIIPAPDRAQVLVRMPVFIFGDHATRHIPPEFNDLGLSGDDLTRHIAWDLGTDIIVRDLCQALGCGGQIAGVSRLVIDLNRDLEAAGLIPQRSDGTWIAGNQNLSLQQRQGRIEQFYMPYHAQISDQLDGLNHPFVISIHSFTPHPLTGTRREVDIGLLVKHDTESAQAFMRSVQNLGLDYDVRINEPYSAYDLNYTIDRHVAPRGLRHLAIEVRQDHVETDAQARDMAQVLLRIISPLVSA